MITLETSPEAYVIRDGDMEVSFRRLGDRWHHALRILHHGVWRPMLASDEGLPTSEVPPSPAFQDLRCERFQDDIVEFQMLGQSGRAVYSGAIRYDGATHTLDFDLCARGRSVEPPPCTVTRYLIPLDFDVRSDPPSTPGGAEIVASSDLWVRISPAPLPDQPRTELRVDGARRPQCVTVGSQERITPEPSGTGFTVRWRYQMTLGSHP
jgi:hypothetical protein